MDAIVFRIVLSTLIVSSGWLFGHFCLKNKYQKAEILEDKKLATKRDAQVALLYSEIDSFSSIRKDSHASHMQRSKKTVQAIDSKKELFDLLARLITEQYVGLSEEYRYRSRS